LEEKKAAEAVTNFRRAQRDLIESELAAIGMINQRLQSLSAGTAADFNPGVIADLQKQLEYINSRIMVNEQLADDRATQITRVRNGLPSRIKEPGATLAALAALEIIGAAALATAGTPRWAAEFLHMFTQRSDVSYISTWRSFFSKDMSVRIKVVLNRAYDAANAGNGARAETHVRSMLKNGFMMGLSSEAILNAPSVISRLHAIANAKRNLDKVERYIADGPDPHGLVSQAKKALTDAQKIFDADKFKLGKSWDFNTPIGAVMRRVSLAFSSLSIADTIADPQLDLLHKGVYIAVSLFSIFAGGAIYDPNWNMTRTRATRHWLD
jgi:hypothetical protein